MKYILSFIFASFSLLSFAQNYDAAVLKGAKSYTTAIEKNQFEKAVGYVNPNIISMAGGTESILSIMKETKETKKEQGYEVIQTTTKSVGDYYEAGEEIHTLVTQDQIVKIGEAKFKTKAYLLAVSSDQGSSWTYVNLEAYNQKSIKIFFPNFNDDLQIPGPSAADMIEE